MKNAKKNKNGARGEQSKITLRRNFRQEFTHPGRIAGRNPPHLQQQQAEPSHGTIRKPPQIAGKLKLHPSSPIVSQKRRNSIYSRIGRLPVVSARIIPARRPLKSRNTSSTVLGLYPGSIRAADSRIRTAAGEDLQPFCSDVFPGGVFERRV